MKKLILILAFCVVHSLVFGATWTTDVTQAGAGGDCEDGGECSIAEFNALSGDYSDSVFSFSGTFTTVISPGVYGTNGSPVTLDGLESGDYDAISEGSDGQAVIDRTEWYTGQYGFWLDGDDYIVIQDFEIKEFSHGIYIRDSDYITVRRNFIHNGGSNGIMITTTNGGSNNITIGGASGDGNSIKNIGVGTAAGDIVISGSHDIIVSYNHLYATLSGGISSDRGIDGIAPMNGSYDILIEYNSIHGHQDNYASDPFESCGAPCQGYGEDGIDIKDDNCGPGEWSDGTYNIIVRYNHIYDNRQSTIVAQSCTYNLYVYGNKLHESNWASLYIMEGAGGCKNILHDIYFFSNISYEEGDAGIRLHGNAGGASDEFYNIFFFNNTLAENATDGSTSTFCQVTLHDQYALASTYIKNNIFYKSRTGYGSDQERQLYFGEDFTDANLDYNRYYWPDKTSQIYIDAGWDDAIGGSHSAEGNGSEGASGLTDIDNNDYRIASGSAVIDGAVDMGSGAIATLTIQGDSYPVNWDVALGPSTDWNGTIPVDIQSRDTVGWDQGAYSYESDQPIRGMKID